MEEKKITSLRKTKNVLKTTTLNSQQDYTNIANLKEKIMYNRANSNISQKNENIYLKSKIMMNNNLDSKNKIISPNKLKHESDSKLLDYINSNNNNYNNIIGNNNNIGNNNKNNNSNNNTYISKLDAPKNNTGSKNSILKRSSEIIRELIK